MADEAVPLRDDVVAYADGTLARVRVLTVPESERFDLGIKYAMHYGRRGASYPIIRFDNHHGTHELHLDERTYVIEYPGWKELYRAWRAALPTRKRRYW